MTSRREVLKATGALMGATVLTGALSESWTASAAPRGADRPGALPSYLPEGLYNRRQRWLRSASAGLFLHWGMRTFPGYTDAASWEDAITGGGWDPNYWVDEARKLHASYLVLASFHSRLGYSRAWPSKIPGSASTKRDFLGELIAAAKAKGLHVILYMTDDPQWHAEGGHEQLDSAAYSAYKGKQVDLTTRPGFGEYSFDNFVEIMNNYPDLSGFWIDNDNEYWEQNGLYALIRQRRPSWLLSNNNEDTPIMDTVSNEQKVGMVPPYDYPAAVWTPMPRLTEACYKLPSKGQWWFDGSDSTVDHGLNVGRFITNAGSSIKSLMAETAQVNGRFPANQEAFNNFLASYLPAIRESIDDTVGGGYMYGGLQPGAWNDGAYGVVMISKKDPFLQYVHVTTPPTTGILTIRDNGYKIVRVTELRSGKRLPFEQKDGRVTISGIAAWDPYDTVLRVHTAAREGLYPQRQITSTASAAADGFPATGLTDGSFLTWWDSGEALPVSVTLDLGRRLPVSFLAINQREWSPTYNRETFGRKEDSARIKDYEVYVSDDGKEWGAPILTGVLESARGVRFIDLDVPRTRYVRLTVNTTWAAATVPAFYQKLGIDEMRVGWRSPVGHDHVD
ncbi:alpha-L-fucosidase [Streptomyces sp. NPDC002387]|uniref:alpha-L-fucosidase n=1 Tax=unclassified Streptomyces TaxID=2593676 RepID=UPI0036B7BD0A